MLTPEQINAADKLKGQCDPTERKVMSKTLKDWGNPHVVIAELRKELDESRTENKRWREAFWDKSNGESEYCKYVSTPEGARAMLDTHVEEAVETDKQIGNLLAVVDAAKEVVDETLAVMNAFSNDEYKPRNAKWTALVEALKQAKGGA